MWHNVCLTRPFQNCSLNLPLWQRLFFWWNPNFGFMKLNKFWTHAEILISKGELWKFGKCEYHTGNITLSILFSGYHIAHREYPPNIETSCLSLKIFKFFLSISQKFVLKMCFSLRKNSIKNVICSYGGAFIRETRAVEPFQSNGARRRRESNGEDSLPRLFIETLYWD